MGQGKTILVAAATASLMTGLILKFAVPHLLDQATRKMLAISASVMSEGLTILARELEAMQTVGVHATSEPNGITTTWPVPNAVFKYVN